MDQPVFVEDNERIHNFVRLTYIALSGTGSVPLRRLEDAYRTMRPTIHEGVGDAKPDCGAIAYAAQRLPPCATRVRKVLLGQTESILEERGVPVSSWTEVFARARRRRYLHDGGDTLLCFIASKSDVDDIIPALLALQTEWNKIHGILAPLAPIDSLPGDAQERTAAVAALLGIGEEDAKKLETAFPEGIADTLGRMRSAPMDLYVRNFEASYCRYRRETETWWRQIQDACPGIDERPVYFVSSNTHSLINLLSGWSEVHRGEIYAFAASDPELSALLASRATVRRANRGQGRSGPRELATAGRVDPGISVGKARDGGAPRAGDAGAGDAGVACAGSPWAGEEDTNLPYYLLMRYEQADPTGRRTALRLAYEERVGIRRISPVKTLDIPTQVADLRLLAESCTPGIRAAGAGCGIETDAVVLNIDYPLGRTAYFILDKLGERLSRMRGVYVIGKAASLAADRGDIVIPSSIVDQHTRNRYFFENCIRVDDVEPYLDAGTHGIYDNQKAATVLGTFLQNREMLDAFLAAGITDLEMEAGPYLAALYEMTLPKRYPENETLSFRSSGIDLGIVHYVSDNPLAGRHLDRRLDLDGIDATYAASRAVLDRIMSREGSRRDSR